MSDTPDPLFAGHLCATHVGMMLRIDDLVGVCHAITLTRDRPTVRVILHERTTELRTDGSMLWRHHCLTLDPRTVVVMVES